MRRIAHVLVAVTSILTAATIGTSSAGAAGEGDEASDAAFVSTLMFATPMADFTADATGHVGPGGVPGDAWFDWSTDLCSAPLVGNTGRSFDFTEPCRRHDFGYRNYRLLDARYAAGSYWNHANRRHIDQQFLADMKAHCRHRSILLKPTCMSWAYTYYSAVRAFGGP